jgi:PUA domain protein
VKSSVQRGIKAKIVKQYPAIADYINQIFPKKDPMVVVKWYVSIAKHEGVLNIVL